jgi:excisionase family DNA binding protein
VTQLLTVSELSRRTGISRTTIHRALADGRLTRYVITAPNGRRLLEPEAVAFCTNGGIRGRVDSPWMPWNETPAAPVAVTAEGAAKWANALLIPGAWGPPPWDGGQWVTLSGCWLQAVTLAEEHGEFDAALFAELEEASDDSD